uniref:SCAN box domain-containing protein n=1 Tax=Crocodylus porosus TaxID=8502 RepID=A0A7M4E7Y2_CROPO
MILVAAPWMQEQDPGGEARPLAQSPRHSARQKRAPGRDAGEQEMRRRRFRGLRYQEGEGPRRVCSRLRELCRRWLEPQHRSKEQILELVVLEQFLAILPREMQSGQWGRSVETCAEAVTLAEGLHLGPLRTWRCTSRGRSGSCWEMKTRGFTGTRC